MAGSVVWVDVLPSGRRYGSALTKITMSSATSAGISAGGALDAGLAKGASRGGGAAKFFSGVARTGLKATGALVGGVTAVGGAIATVAAKKGLDRLLDIDDAQSKLKGLGRTQVEITSIMDSALASVKGTAFGLGDAATIASGAVAAGVKPGKDLTKYLSLTADAASIAGTSLGEMGAIINKTTTTGKVYTDNLNQLADRGIPIFQWLQKEYGVSATDLSLMVKKGEVDSATFRKVIQENIGGAALASGQSVRGAAANMGAALGRLGAMFLKGPVSAAPGVFASLTGATDRAGEALQPYADKITAWVVPALQSFAKWVDTIDFVKVAADLESFGGKAVAWFSRIGGAIKTGDVSGVGSAFGGFIEAIKPLAPVGGAVLKSLAPLSSTISDLLVSAIKLAQPVLEGLTSIFTWLGDHTELLVPILIGLGAAFVMMKTGAAAARVTAVAMLPITILQIAADLARTRALTLNTRAMLANTAQENRGRLARVPATFDILNQGRALVFQRIAMAASTGASKAGALGMRLFGAAVRFAMGPVGIIITVIGLLVAAVIWAYNNVGWFRDLVNGAFAVIGNAAKVVGSAFVWLWTNAIKPALTAIGAAVGYLWSTWISPIFQLIGAIIAFVWSTIIKPVFMAIAVFAKNVVGGAISWLYNTIIKPIFALIGLVISAWWNYYAKPILTAVVFLVKNVLGPAFSWLYRTIIKPVFDKLTKVAEKTIPAAFTTMKTGVKTAFDLIKTAAKAPIKFVIETVLNDGIIANFNKVAGFFKTKKLPEISLPKGFSGGGYTGDGGKYQPAGIVHKGEYVIPKDDTARLGVGRIRSFIAGMPGYANGGLVGAASGAWDWVKGKASGAVNWAKDVADTAQSIVSDPMGTLGKLVKGAIGNIPGAGGMLDVAKGVGSKVLTGAIDLLKGLGDKVGGSGKNGDIPKSALGKASGFAPGPGVGAIGGYLRLGAARAWNAARAASGGLLSLTEGYRDRKAQEYRWSLFKAGGNLAAMPGTSVHGLGLAADVGSGQAWLRANGGRFGWQPTGLSFSQREPWHFEYKGAPSTATNSTGGATLYDNGGMLPPGLSLVANKTGRPEPVLTGDQFDALTRRGEGGDSPLIGRDLVIKTTGGAPTIRKVRRTLRSIKRGGPSA